jgi:hypothetical protein
MTYYGRWTYKYEELARRGAAGALIIHEDAPAGYGWNTVKNSWSAEQLDIQRTDIRADRPIADYMLWALVLGSFAAVIVCVALDELSAWSLLVLGALPAASLTVRMLRETEPVRLNLLVRNSARLHMHLGLLLALGLAIEAL